MKRQIIIFLFILGLLVACNGEQAGTDATNPTTSSEEITAETDQDTSRPAGWTAETHSNDTEPNYEVVFPQDKVNQITITIAPEDWEAMQADMTELFGEAGQGGGPGGGFGGPPGGEGFQPPADGELPEGFQPPADGELPEGFQPPGGGPGFGGGDFTTENPMWVAATIEFDGNTWTNVGVRYKGNSSLRSGWSEGTLKLPFKLDFDEFEDDYPEIADQRFYGFKQLSLSNSFSDSSYMRDSITYDLLEEAGLVAAETAFYEVILDYGEGPVSLGLYTMVEVIDDTVIERSFSNDSGNIYEGDGTAASLAEGTFDQIADSFQKENNEDEADWSDIESLYEALHSEQRTTNPEAWRAELEAIFDVNTFLEWLALSAVIQHWDTYGAMTHNFYLYNNPDTGLLTWISWDHNMVLGSGPGGSNGPNNQANNANNQGPGGRMGPGSVTLDKENVDDNWPLIRYLLDDPVYHALYMEHVQETTNGLFNPDELAAKYQQIAELIAPYAAADSSAEAFETAVQELTDRTYEQYETAVSFLATQP